MGVASEGVVYGIVSVGVVRRRGSGRCGNHSYWIVELHGECCMGWVW